jgi:hypothetical protein
MTPFVESNLVASYHPLLPFTKWLFAAQDRRSVKTSGHEQQGGLLSADADSSVIVSKFNFRKADYLANPADCVTRPFGYFRPYTTLTPIVVVSGVIYSPNSSNLGALAALELVNRETSDSYTP